jgi:NAD(P)-dependent dehydrogenase (short-subunit alcohol dehydrogenase family)
LSDAQGGDAVPVAGKVAAVTGASRGTGMVIARRLAEEGAQVALIARASDRLDAAAKAIPGALALPTELGRPEEVRNAFERIHGELGRLDILVNNAAMAVARPIDTYEDDELQVQVDANFLGAVYCVRSSVPLLRRTQGHIVNVSSESANDPFPYLLMYGATKAALEVFTKGLLNELRPDHIRVTLLVSGFTNTGFSTRWDPELRAAATERWEREGYLTRVAGHAPQEPEDVAEAVLFAVTRPPRTMVDVIWSRAAN